MSCLLMSSIHFPRQNTCLCSNSPSPFAGRGFKKNKLMYIHIFKQSALLLEKLQEKQSPYCCFTLRAIHWEKQPKIKKKQCRSWKKKQTNVSLINITGRINCCMKCSISTTALWDQYKLSLLNVVKKKKKSCLDILKNNLYCFIFITGFNSSCFPEAEAKWQKGLCQEPVTPFLTDAGPPIQPGDGKGTGLCQGRQAPALHFSLIQSHLRLLRVICLPSSTWQDSLGFFGFFFFSFLYFSTSKAFKIHLKGHSHYLAYTTCHIQAQGLWAQLLDFAKQISGT